jgi:hypothetical protein
MKPLELRTAVLQILNLMFRSTESPLSLEHLDQLNDAAETLDREWPLKDENRGRVEYIVGTVRTNGYFSSPARTLRDTQNVLSHCQGLQRYLDRFQSPDEKGRN